MLQHCAKEQMSGSINGDCRLSEKAVNALYIHIPFCATKCIYCAFFSAPPSGNQIERYCRAILKELEMAARVVKPKTIFFGGGTPSLLNVRHWKYILTGMERLNLLGAEEFTIECNPATVSAEKALLWLDYGVNRVSLGVQSFNDNLLKFLGRIHDKKTALATYEILRKSGFKNINIDLMFGIPEQTLEDWRQTLSEALALQPEHISSYELTPEEDTEYFKKVSYGFYKTDEELVSAMYEELVEKTHSAGLYIYEVSNFAKDTHTTNARDNANQIPVYACKHNINYWRGGYYFGAGASASGFLNGIRTKNVSNTNLYCELLEKGKQPISEIDNIPPLNRAAEIAAFGLRMTAGWNFDEFKKITGFDLNHEWRNEIDQLVRLGYAVQDEKSFRLTSTGLRYADWAGELFLK
jgi:oxygen-independent coproporphyrinogen-3 oxidase